MADPSRATQTRASLLVSPQEDDVDQSSTAMNLAPANNLVGLLTLHKCPSANDLWVGAPDPNWLLPRTFGGLTVAQALIAASHTVPNDRRVHSLHSYFILGGVAKLPIAYQVHRTRDGQSFSNRRVQAIQNKRVILEINMSFQVDTESPVTLEHQKRLPATLPSPEQCNPFSERVYSHIKAHHPDFVAPGQMRYLKVKKEPSAESSQLLWFRAFEDSGLGSSHSMHCAVAAFFSDHLFLVTAAVGHVITNHNMSSASLCHSMWFHKPFRADEWLLHHMTSPVAASERGLCFGHIYTQQGELVASTAQEGLLRVSMKETEQSSDAATIPVGSKL